MNTDLHFATGNDVRETPQDLFDKLNEEFDFLCDVAAIETNTKCIFYIGPDHSDPSFRDALTRDWSPGTNWCNPPYSRGLQGKFIAKAWEQAQRGRTTVMLLPARTDTASFHTYIWDQVEHKPYHNVEVRFLRGRLKFDQEKNAAPFPSMVVIFRGEQS